MPLFLTLSLCFLFSHFFFHTLPSSPSASALIALNNLPIWSAMNAHCLHNRHIEIESRVRVVCANVSYFIKFSSSFRHSISFQFSIFFYVVSLAFKCVCNWRETKYLGFRFKKKTHLAQVPMKINDVYQRTICCLFSFFSSFFLSSFLSWSSFRILKIFLNASMRVLILSIPFYKKNQWCNQQFQCLCIHEYQNIVMVWFHLDWNVFPQNAYFIVVITI